MAYQRKYTSSGGNRPAAPQQSAPAFTTPTKGSIPTQKILRISLIVVAVVLVIAGLYVTSSQGTKESIKFERSLLETKAAPTASSIFSEARTLDLRAGNGVEFTFRTLFRGEVVFQKELKLSAWNKLDEWTASRPARTEEIEQLIRQFDQIAQEWADAPPITAICDVAVDTSGGVDAALQSMISDRMNNTGCPQLALAGVGLEFTGFRFGATDYLDFNSVVIAPGSKNVAGVIDAINNVSKTTSAKETTSLAASLFNILGKNNGKKFRTAVIFSDGIQFGHGADFYKKPPSDRSQYQKILDTLEKEGGVECPDLTGVEVYWYFTKDSEHAQQIRAARDFWTYVIQKNHGAIKQMEF
jgi:hypothetical protein